MNPYPNIHMYVAKFGCKAQTLRGQIRFLRSLRRICWNELRTDCKPPRVDLVYAPRSNRRSWKAWYHEVRCKELYARCEECDKQLRNILYRWLCHKIDVTALVKSQRATLEYGHGGAEAKAWPYAKSYKFPAVWKNAGWRIIGDLTGDIEIVVENYRGNEKHRFKLSWQQVRLIIQHDLACKRAHLLGVPKPECQELVAV